MTCFVRRHAGVRGTLGPDDTVRLLAGAAINFGDVTQPNSLAHDGFRGEHFDAVVSCLASRTGAPADAWAIDYHARIQASKVAREAGVTQFVLLSAIFVQKPLLRPPVGIPSRAYDFSFHAPSSAFSLADAALATKKHSVVEG